MEYVYEFIVMMIFTISFLGSILIFKDKSHTTIRGVLGLISMASIIFIAFKEIN
jgi:hypothetical protein